MISSIRNLSCAACLLFGAVAEAVGPFVPPEEKIPPFRRDRLPIDSHNMAGLALNVWALTMTGTSHTPEERRSLAKACAIVIALMPENEQIKEQVISLQDGEHSRRITEPDKVEKIHKQVWRYFEWLSAPEAGKDGNILASYLGDVIASFDADHEAATIIKSRSDPKLWDGWVAPLDQFTEKKQEQPDELGDRTEEEPEQNTDRPDRVRPSIRLEKANLTTVLRTYDKEKFVWSPNLVNVTMDSSKDSYKEDWEEEQSSIRVHISAEEEYDWAAHDMVASPIKDMLQKLMGDLPRRGRIRIKANDDGYEYGANHGALTGPGLVLAHSCLTGKLPVGTVIGEIGRDGNIILPEHFWRQLMLLCEKGEGGRLVLPAEAEEYMTALLVLGKAEFFLKYEVLVASSPEEFLLLSSSEPGVEHSAIFEQFAEIMDKAPKGQAGSYIANRFVRQRLQEIVDTAPYHVSAKMLALQGAGSHPRYLSQKVLAAEIWRSVEIIGQVAEVNFWEINSRQIARLDELQTEIRASLNALERFSDTRDRGLVRSSMQVVDTMKFLYRDLKAKDDEYGSRMEAVMKTRDRLEEGYDVLSQELSRISGDPLRDAEGKRKRYRLKAQEE